LTPACPYTPIWTIKLNGVIHTQNEFLSISGSNLLIGKTTTSKNYMTPNPHNIVLEASYAMSNSATFTKPTL
jgi:DNA transposition AAA+ family ATPase